MARTIDPGRDAVLADLRAFRKGTGHPEASRLDDLFDLTEALGEGIAERAFAAFERHYREIGDDPESDIGAYFYLAGWGVGGHSIDQRRRWYRDSFLCDVSTAWRRSERGMERLATLIRDHWEASRPWAVISVFQTGDSFQAFLDFNLGYESWRPPIVQLNGVAVDDLAFELRVADESDQNRNGPGTRYTGRVVLPETTVLESSDTGTPLGRVRVIWDMPIWPVWQTFGWTTDPDTYVSTRTFRERAIEVAVRRSVGEARRGTEQSL